MPELPEVQTTVNGLKEHVIGLTVKDVWTSYNSKYFIGSKTIKDPAYFKLFKKEIVGRKIISVSRRAKNILIELDKGHTLLIHMKMTGHLLFGKYLFANNNWTPLKPESLKDPYNRHIRFVITFTNGKHLALADVRKFAKVILDRTENIHNSIHLKSIGPEPLDKDFTLEQFSSRLDTRPNAPIKIALMDQTVIAGVGNIYADESLWRAGIHPSRITKKVSSNERKRIFDAIKQTLSKGIDFGGDSMSDYRNIRGEKGSFQENHRAYRRTGSKCDKRGCKGTIKRIVIGGRSTHFCDVHQK